MLCGSWGTAAVPVLPQSLRSGSTRHLTGSQTAWPLLESPAAPREDGPTYLPDGRVIFVQDGNIWMMAAQPGAQKVLLADLPFTIRDLDARGA